MLLLLLCFCLYVMDHTLVNRYEIWIYYQVEEVVISVVAVAVVAVIMMMMKVVSYSNY